MNPARRSDFTPLVLRILNLALLVAYPFAWFAPLMRAALLPLFGMEEISLVSGLQSLWASDAPLAVLVTFMALFAPFAKTLGLSLLQFGLLSQKLAPALDWLGKCAMADIFLMALYIVIAKGAGYVTIEIAWGLYLFSGCVITSLIIAGLSHRRTNCQRIEL